MSEKYHTQLNEKLKKLSKKFEAANNLPSPTLEFEFSKYEEDCPAVNVCKAVKEECRKGAEIRINSRCSGAEVHNVLTKYNNQTITFYGNVTQFSQGDNTQLTIKNQLPPELIEELVKLLNSEKTDKAGWISWFNKATTFIGDLTAIADFLSKL